MLKPTVSNNSIVRKYTFLLILSILLITAVLLTSIHWLWSDILNPYFNEQIVANIRRDCDDMSARMSLLTNTSDMLLYNQDTKIQEHIVSLSSDMLPMQYSYTYSMISEPLADFSPFYDAQTSVYGDIITRAYIVNASGEVVTRKDSLYYSTYSRIEKIRSLVQAGTDAQHGKFFYMIDPNSPNTLIAARNIYRWSGPQRFDTVDTVIATFILELNANRFFSPLTDSNENIDYSFASENGDVIWSTLHPASNHTSAYKRSLGNTGYYITATLDQSSIAKEIIGAIGRIALIVVLCVLLILAFMLRISKGISAEFEALISKLQSIREINEDALLPVMKDDEIGKLSTVFNDMVQRVIALNIKVNERELLLKNAELSTFQSQINPHFLYNTLDCINSLIEFDRKEETQRTVTALGKIMRMAIKGPDFITISTDLEYINQYLFIQKMRYQEHILFLTEIPESIGAYMIPKLILQPIIENAIVHGVANCIRQGMVFIQGKETGDSIEFFIKDNGVGMPDDIIQSINEKFENHPDDRLDRTHIGLYNIQRRLQLLFGSAADIHITQLPEGGTCVLIRIPKISEGVPYEPVHN